MLVYYQDGPFIARILFSFCRTLFCNSYQRKYQENSLVFRQSLAGSAVAGNVQEDLSTVSLVMGKGMILRIKLGGEISNWRFFGQ